MSFKPAELPRPTASTPVTENEYLEVLGAVVVVGAFEFGVGDRPVDRPALEVGPYRMVSHPAFSNSLSIAAAIGKKLLHRPL